MKAELNEVLWLDHQHELTLYEVAALSGLDETELLELVEHGAIAPSDPARQLFAAHCVTAARTASRLRRDFELDASGLALVMTLLEQVRELEQQLNALRALMPRRML